jgi:hypothetical protein
MLVLGGVVLSIKTVLPLLLSKTPAIGRFPPLSAPVPPFLDLAPSSIPIVTTIGLTKKQAKNTGNERPDYSMGSNNSTPRKPLNADYT